MLGPERSKHVEDALSKDCLVYSYLARERRAAAFLVAFTSAEQLIVARAY